MEQRLDDIMTKSKPMRVDLNSDLGESLGLWRMGSDAEILPYISSANIACGFHAGDPAIMRETVQNALEEGVAIGAHPSLPDLVGFGRRNIAITPEEAYDLIIYQVGALMGFLKLFGASLHHVKPHGALYQMAARDESLALAVAQAVADLTNGEAILYGLAGSELIKAGRSLGLSVANEVFADRTYQEDGHLTSRLERDALITDPDIAIAQVLQMVVDNEVTTTTGVVIPLECDTICIHGDGVTARQFAHTIHHALRKRGIMITSSFCSADDPIYH